MFYTLYLIYIRVGFVYTYSAWASGVARSTGKGNARAIVSGTSNEVQTLTLFRTYDNLKRQLICFAGEAQDT